MVHLKLLLFVVVGDEIPPTSARAGVPPACDNLNAPNYCVTNVLPR